MTIRHKERVIFDETTIGAKGALLGALTGGPRTVSLKLSPDPNEPLNDTVIISASYGSYEVKGSEINSNSTCRKNQVNWSPYLHR